MRTRLLIGLLALLFSAGGAGAFEFKPLIYSALVPGLGEWSLGYKKRAVAHWVVEAGCWAGNFYYRDQGFKKRHEYEAFALEHWDTMRWASAWNNDMPAWLQEWFTTQEWNEADRWPSLISHAVAFNEAHSPDGQVPYLQSHYAAYQDDSQHYFENLGKYDWYRWGWDDYDETSDRSANRYVYSDLRNSSDDSFNTAHKFVTLLVVARVVSLADTFILLHRMEQGSSYESASKGWRFDFAPTDITDGGFRVALVRSW